MTRHYDSALDLSEKRAALTVFARQRDFAEHCFGQLDDERFFRRPAEGVNSVAIIVRHLAGNMRSRWSDFPAMLAGDADGEMASRDRDGEFREPEPTPEGRAALMRAWDEGWSILYRALEPLTTEDLDRTVTIRDVSHSVHLAVARQLDHYAFHVGQIATTARILVPHASWRFYTVPPGGSAAFTARVRGARRESKP